MEDQIVNAIHIALDESADQKLQLQACEFLNEVKSSKNGYDTALTLLAASAPITSPISSATPASVSASVSASTSAAAAANTASVNSLAPELKFYLFGVIEENTDELNQEECHQLSLTMFKLLSAYILHQVKDPPYLKNKLAQVFAKIFTRVYLTTCPNFLVDLLASIESNSQLAVDYYTRILISIHLEIGDKYIRRSPSISERNNLLRDAIRDKDMTSLVSSWFKILSDTNNTSEILNNTLNIIAQYVDWMEISLFVSPRTISIIASYFQREGERNSTCETLIRILSKKMPPSNKLELITLLNLPDLITIIDLSQDIEFVEHVAKLANQMGEELIIVLGNDPNTINEVTGHLRILWPIILTFLGHEYDDVSQVVFSFIQQFLAACKKYSQLYSMELLSSLLNKLIIKMKYSDDEDGGGGGDDDDGKIDSDEETEQQFTEFRARLKLFQDNIAILAPDLYIETIPVVINESLFSGDKSWRTLELGLFELNNFSESLKSNYLNVPKNKINESKLYSILQEFLIKLIESSFLLEVNHPHIQSSFFELVVKHYSFLNSHENRKDLVLRILEIFTSPLGLFNNNEKVRLRSWYLFFRFMKLTKPKMDSESLIEQIIVKLQPLLIIKAELPTRDEDDDIVENGNFNNQQYLFETMGLLISLIPNELSSLKVKLMGAIFQPIFNDLEKCISIADKEPIIVLQAHHSLMALGTIVRGYDYETNLKFSLEIVEKVDNAAQVVLITLENFPKSESIRDASRFAFARFIPILSTSNISAHLTKLITIIWSAPNLKIREISDFMSFLGQIAHSYRANENIYQLLNNFLSPLFTKVFDTLDQSTSEADELRPDILRDKNFLKKAVLNFVNALIINHLASLLITESNKNEFPVVVSKLFEYAYDLSDTAVSKLSIVQLINLVNVFGEGGKITDKEDSYGQALPAVEGIDEFLMEKVVNLSFELPFQKQEFDLSDAQYRLIAQDIAMLLKTYQQKRGDSFVKYLSTYLTNMGLGHDMMNEFCTSLINMDSKEFKKYFVLFISRMKGDK
ncbi:LOS1 [Candida oxycetoniae]|uniref:Exportin-T n=1 Tax=Candida oxycetoniae TaxID=497107 RepID=A0AAI9SXT7_9ASCO|nr:LOS1 [Candida oxycetoniae]KAI3405087.2 LOS1 [Candida oxycetoniae]